MDLSPWSPRWKTRVCGRSSTWRTLKHLQQWKTWWSTSKNFMVIEPAFFLWLRHQEQRFNWIFIWLCMYWGYNNGVLTQLIGRYNGALMAAQLGYHIIHSTSYDFGVFPKIGYHPERMGGFNMFIGRNEDAAICCGCAHAFGPLLSKARGPGPCGMIRCKLMMNSSAQELPSGYVKIAIENDHL